MDRHGPSYRESVLGRGWAQFRRRSRVGKALRKPRFPQGMGSLETGRQRTGSNWGMVVRLFHTQYSNDSRRPKCSDYIDFDHRPRESSRTI